MAKGVTTIHSVRAGDLVRRKLALLLTRRLCPSMYGFGPFLRRGDLISQDSLINGRHEAYTDALVDCAVSCGYDGFFVDVGANIGLTLYQNAAKFPRCVAFEPNGMVFPALTANAGLIDHPDISLHPVGIGPDDAELELMVPRHNMGGAYLREGNAYSDELLAAKDQLDGVTDGYLRQTVRIIGPASLAAIIAERLPERVKGFVKIDVEGYEQHVLSALLPLLGARPTCVFFENWSAVDVAELRKRLRVLVDDRMALRIATLDAQTWNRAGRLRQIGHLLTGGTSDTVLAETLDGDTIEHQDIVVEIAEEGAHRLLGVQQGNPRRSMDKRRAGR